MITTDDRIGAYTMFRTRTDRAELTRALGVPMPTVVSAVRRLVGSGRLVETDPPASATGVGRPARGLRLAGPPTAVGLLRWDGSVLRATVVDTDGGTLVERDLDVPDPDSGVDGLHDVVAHLVAMARRRRGHRLRSVVLSVPAPFLSGRGAPIHRAASGEVPRPFLVTASGDVETVLSRRHGVPVLMENDANLAALGELADGAAAGVANVVYVRITPYGFGSAVIVNGELARGARGYAGELAHLQVDRDGPLCACGGRGCLLYRVRERVVESAQPAYAEPIGFGDLPRLTDEGDAGAARMMRDIGRVLGDPLAHLCTFLDPDLLLVGGLHVAAADQVIAGIREVFAVQAPPAIGATLTVAAAHTGIDADVHGAIAAARDHAMSSRPVS